MSERFDVLKSLFREAATGARDRILGAGPIARAREAFKEIARQRAMVPDADLTNAIAHAYGVRSASATARDGAVRVDVMFEDGDHLAASFIPLGARFAPRGAKEILFRVEPPERAVGPKAAEVAAALAGAVARGLYRGLLRVEEGTQGAIVDRDDDVLRIDLRTVPAVRKMAGRGAIAMLMDVMEVRSIRADDGILSIDLKLPEIVV